MKCKGIFSYFFRHWSENGQGDYPPALSIDEHESQKRSLPLSREEKAFHAVLFACMLLVIFGVNIAGLEKANELLKPMVDLLGGELQTTLLCIGFFLAILSLNLLFKNRHLLSQNDQDIPSFSIDCDSIVPKYHSLLNDEINQLMSETNLPAKQQQPTEETVLRLGSV